MNGDDPNEESDPPEAQAEASPGGRPDWVKGVVEKSDRRGESKEAPPQPHEDE